MGSFKGWREQPGTEEAGGSWSHAERPHCPGARSPTRCPGPPRAGPGIFLLSSMDLGKSRSVTGLSFLICQREGRWGNLWGHHCVDVRCQTATGRRCSPPEGIRPRLPDVLGTGQMDAVNLPSSEDRSPSTPSCPEAHTFSAFREMFFKHPVWEPGRQQRAEARPLQ